MNQIRILKTGAKQASYNMGLDEAVATLLAEGKAVPTLRLYAWEPTACSIGYFQSIGAELDLDRCKEFGIDVVRRITGGGAVFHEYEVTYSFIAPLSANYVPQKVLDSYLKVSEGIIRGLAQLGLSIEFKPLNDLVCQGKKISGNAQTRRNGILLQHGTILLQVDVDKMFSILKVPNEKIRDKLIQDVKERVTSVEQVLGRSVRNKEVEDVLLLGFQETFTDLEFVAGELSAEEQLLAEKLASEKYESDEWNFKTP
ncbi:MAG: biotin/lipoate A/B protein ligase family protein [Candidatus Gracilibacteria bacterium]|nr:biotin/lipoate A/B protein ligase family protein [Candidatus Gracilibacteria bacterium]